mgnify:CR=1 FL=1
MDAYQKLSKQQHEISEAFIHEFIDLMKKTHNCKTLQDCRDVVMREMLAAPTDQKNWHPMREIYAKLKQMVRNESGGINNVY